MPMTLVEALALVFTYLVFGFIGYQISRVSNRPVSLIWHTYHFREDR